MQNFRKNVNGITLMALVVTIIILLILAGISIGMLSGDNSIINQAGNAKTQTDIAQEKEILEQATVVVMGKSKYGDIEKAKLDTELSKYSEVEETETVEEGIVVSFKSKRAYLVDANGKVIDYEKPEYTPKPEQSTKYEVSRANGRIDIIFLNGTSYNITEKPNPPVLDNTMVPVYYDNTISSWKVCDSSDTDTWYKYSKADVSIAGTTEGDTRQSRWANVMLTDNIQIEKDGITYNSTQIKGLLKSNNLRTIVGATVTNEGSMLVWIPRYAYRITYYSSSNKTKGTEIGYSDSRGLVDIDGKTPKNLQEPTTSINVKGNIETKNYEYYRPHPAFEKDLNQGGWRTKITGIWVGKFEVTGNTTETTILSNTKPLYGVSIGDQYNAIKNKFKAGTTESHMIKNSEYGATAYLTESIYGRNEVQITKNTYSPTPFTGGNNYILNTSQSTTGNVYGVYDMFGGTNELVSSYSANNTTNNGYGFTSISGNYGEKNDKTASTEYATVYQYNVDSDSNANNYKLNLNRIFGDAMFETSGEGTLSTSWYGSTSYFAGTSYPFFTRGGDFGNGEYRIIFL